jgi:transcriptional regulator with XRE-family HTH domain
LSSEYPETASPKIGEALKRYRTTVANPLTQEYIAQRLGITQSVLSRWESGQVALDLAGIVRYADLLGFDVAITMTKRKGSK